MLKGGKGKGRSQLRRKRKRRIAPPRWCGKGGRARGSALGRHGCTLAGMTVGQKVMEEPVVTAAAPRPLGGAAVRALGSIAGPIIGLVLVLGIFGGWRPDTFLSAEAFRNVFDNNYHYAVAAVGATFVIITAGIDLSVGSTMLLANVLCALAIRGMAFPRFDPAQDAIRPDHLVWVIVGVRREVRRGAGTSAG